MGLIIVAFVLLTNNMSNLLRKEDCLHFCTAIMLNSVFSTCTFDIIMEKGQLNTECSVHINVPMQRYHNGCGAARI